MPCGNFEGWVVFIFPWVTTEVVAYRSCRTRSDNIALLNCTNFEMDHLYFKKLFLNKKKNSTNNLNNDKLNNTQAQLDNLYKTFFFLLSI